MYMNENQGDNNCQPRARLLSNTYFTQKILRLFEKNTIRSWKEIICIIKRFLIKESLFFSQYSIPCISTSLCYSYLYFLKMKINFKCRSIWFHDFSDESKAKIRIHFCFLPQYSGIFMRKQRFSGEKMGKTFTTVGKELQNVGQFICRPPCFNHDSRGWRWSKKENFNPALIVLILSACHYIIIIKTAAWVMCILFGTVHVFGFFDIHSILF